MFNYLRHQVPRGGGIKKWILLCEKCRNQSSFSSYLNALCIEHDIMCHKYQIGSIQLLRLFYICYLASHLSLSSRLLNPSQGPIIILLFSFLYCCLHHTPWMLLLPPLLLLSFLIWSLHSVDVRLSDEPRFFLLHQAWIMTVVLSQRSHLMIRLTNTQKSKLKKLMLRTQLKMLVLKAKESGVLGPQIGLVSCQTPSE